MNKLNRFYLSQNISIDNALSMNQILHQIVNQIKEIVDFINNLELRANEYTDEQIRLLNERLQAQLETLEQTLKTYTSDSIDNYNATIINPQLTEIRNTIDTLNRTINARIDDEVGILNRRISSVESTLNKKIDDTKEYLEELIKKGNQLVYSSISGRKIPIQDTLFEMGNALKQILSYNWNTLNILKYGEYDLSTYTKFSDGTVWSDIYYKVIETPNGTNTILAVGGQGNLAIQIRQATGSTVVISDGDGYVTINDVETTKQGKSSIIFYSSEIETLLNSYVNKIKIPITVDDVLTYATVYLVNVNYTNDNRPKITFNSLHNQMTKTDFQSTLPRPNWNGLTFGGVNGFFVLSLYGGLYDDDSYINNKFYNALYHNIVYRNENSSFYNQIENQENGGN